MQKINFLPQVKVWNGIEFHGAYVQENPTPAKPGILSYDSSTNSFKVSILTGESQSGWKTIFLSDSSTGTLVNKIILQHEEGGTADATLDGNVILYTGSAYNASTNKLATMSDIADISTGIAQVNVDSNSIVTSGIANLYSDPSSLYNASTNQLATLGTVSAAISAIPVQDGTVANGGLMDVSAYNAIQNVTSYGVDTYVALLNPSTLTGTIYTNISAVNIEHNIGNSNVFVSVYANKDANATQKQMVYVDEVIADTSTITVDFGSSSAFVGCQEKDNMDNYYGYTVVIGCSKQVTNIPDTSISPVLP